MMDDDDDDFLYGVSTSTPKTPQTQPVVTSEPQPVALDKLPLSNGIVARLEAEAAESAPQDTDNTEAQADETLKPDDSQSEQDVEEQEDVGDDEESEDDIEFVYEAPARSVDFRQQRPPVNRTVSAGTPNAPRPPQPVLTTEYTPHQRGGPPAALTPARAPSATQPPQPSTPITPTAAGLVGTTTLQTPQQAAAPQPSATPVGQEGPNPATLPPVTAPATHPHIDPTATGLLEGRSILEVDLDALSDKAWRRPGADISEWFNYGFDELSWEAYCYRRRDIGDLGNTLKQNVVNFAGMPEEQLSALPMEVRQMVMTGATAMAANPNMMNPAMNHPMMDMNMMMGMNGGDMNGMQMQPGGPMMQVPDARQMMQDNGGGGGPTPGMGGVPMGSVTQENGPGMMQDVGGGFGPNVPGMMNMGGNGDFGGQDANAMAQQQMFSNMEGNATPVHMHQPVPRGGGQLPFRGRAGTNMRGRAGFQGRGRGRGGMYTDSSERPPIPVRPASPLPPGVPTGPRNQNKYKDRDNNGPAVDGLDYGGTNKESTGRPHSGEPEERERSASVMSRKRRGSPSMDESRGQKRR